MAQGRIRKGLLSVFALGVFGLVFAGAFNTVMDYTNTTEFCVSCHSMQQNYKELQQTVHWKNSHGAHAECASCHVPKAFLPKMKVKIIAIKDVYHEIVGTIDTPEKYEARRWQMANAVWEKMRASDSRECRSCHAYDNMDLTLQDKFAAKKHPRAMERGKTCIDCHQGIVHKLPEEPDENQNNI